ncbi:MAG: YceI family protein [Bacteroidia bacterium]
MKQAFLSLALLLAFTAQAQIFKGKKEASSISFSSKTPLEDIEAVNKNPIIGYNAGTGDMQLSVVMTQFKFKAALMEEHFNENYVESNKFPQATFKGKVNEKVDLTNDGETKVTVTGKMTLHGVTKDMTAEGTITKKGNEILLNSAFKIKIADYDIKVPTVVTQKIAEVIDVIVKGVLEPMAKK